MSVIRIASEDKLELVELADKILTAWRGYTDGAHSFMPKRMVKSTTPSPRLQESGTANSSLT